MPPRPSNISSSPTPSNATSPDAPASLQSFSLQAVTESKVLKELLKLGPKKPSGSDGLDPFFIKFAAPIIAKPISNLCNLSVLSGEVPIAWKAATVNPLFKGRDQADPNCYRPISILPCLSKVLEKLVNNQLTGFFMSIIFSLVCDLVSDQFIEVLNDVTIALDYMQCFVAIFIDLAKAFDTVDHSIFVGRLRSIGVSDGSLAWFANYLSQIVQCVKSKHLLSQPLPVTNGEPQGLILGLTLSSIYINNIAQAV